MDIHEVIEIPGNDTPVLESDAEEHDTEELEEVEGRGRRFLLRFISVTVFLAVLVGSVSIVAIAGFNSLMTHEEEIKNVWERIQALQAERRDLMADLLDEAGREAVPADVMSEWRRVQSVIVDVTTFQDEVAEQPGVDRAFRSVISAVREAMTVDENGICVAILEKVEVASRQLGIERRLFNEEVAAYRIHLERIPTRWLARVLRFEHIPDYSLNGP